MDDRSKQIRRDTLLLSKANGGYHYGGCFSAVEILIALFDHILQVNDRFILSKGHACWPYYVLLKEKGFNPKLEGHPSRDEQNGIHCSTGSLGHGLPMAIGMAMAKKTKGEDGRIYVLMGDGECQEGTTWESMLIAAHHKLDNLVAIVDWNGIQGSGFNKDILPLGGLYIVADALDWEVDRRYDGHSVEIMTNALRIKASRPLMIIASTTKGKGVSFMENRPEWHAKWPDAEHEARAMREIS